jgi:hypothetical protein
VQSALQQEHSVAFGEDEDFRLSTDNHPSLANLGGASRGAISHQGLIGSRTSKEIRRGMGDSQQLGDGLKHAGSDNLSRDEREQNQLSHEQERLIQESRQQLQQSV